MNPYFNLTNGFTLPGLSGGPVSSSFTLTDDNSSSPIMFNAQSANIQPMNPTESVAYNSGRYINTTAGKGPEIKAGAQSTAMPKSVYAEDVMQTLSANNALPAEHTVEQVMWYTRAASEGVRAASYFVNSALAGYSYKMKAEQYNFLANQNERAAELLYKNMREITRAAQADSNVYKLQGAQTKAKQKTAMAGTGFAVGKGIYKNMLDTTDARTNYNVAMVMLKSDLQNAEIIRKAGTYQAQAAIQRGNAQIANIEKKNAVLSGIINGIGSLAQAGFSFYVGKYGLEGGSTKVTKTTGPTGSSSWAINGKAMYGAS